jgi:hypothetical protein
MLDPFLLTGRGITLGSISVGSRTDFEAMKPGHRPASVAPRDRPVIPVRRRPTQHIGISTVAVILGKS